MKIKDFLIGSASIVVMFGLSVLPVIAAGTTVVVYPGNLHGWTFFDDNGNGGSGLLVNGPATPPLGQGSAQLGLTATNQGYALGNGGYGGVKLADITNLTYSTYVQEGNNTIAPALQLNIDSNVTDNNSSWQGRLVYEPYYTHGVVDGKWQTWNTQDNATSSGVGNWWFSNGTLASTTGCSQATPCTWSDVLTKLPNAGINVSYPGVIFKAGSNWAVPFVGNIDAFTMGVNGSNTTYDFEAHAPLTTPMTKAQCRDGGWKTFNNPTFKNQGKCIDYVEDHDHRTHGENVQYTAYGLLRTANFEADVANQNGHFNYRDDDRNHYHVKISEVVVQGDTAWFAGKVVKASNPSWVGQWLFAKVVDNKPDQIWGSFASQSAAENGVATMANPADGPFTVTKGNIVVH